MYVVGIYIAPIHIYSAFFPKAFSLLRSCIHICHPDYINVTHDDYVSRFLMDF